MFRTFIQVMALALTLIATYFLLRGSLALSVEDIAEQSSTAWGYNLNISENLLQQQVNTRIGFALLLLSFILQMGNLLWPMRICDFGVNKMGALIAIVVSTLVFISSVKVSNLLSRKSLEKVKTTLNEKLSK